MFFLQTKRRKVLVFGLLVVCGLLSALSWRTVAADIAKPTMLSPTAIIAKTNQYRTEAAQTPLLAHPKLQAAAEAKAHAMADASDFSHTLRTGLTPWSFLTEAEYCYQAAAENLAVHFSTNEAVVQGWMNSTTHRANIMSSAYTHIGIGIAQGEWQGHDGYFVVQLFGAEVSPNLQAYVPYCSF